MDDDRRDLLKASAKLVGVLGAINLAGTNVFAQTPQGLPRTKGLPAQAPPAQALQVEKTSGDLNIILTKDQINMIVRSVIGQRGEKLKPGGTKGIDSGYCCVDTSIGSSVVGPISSVYSSTNVPNPDGRMTLQEKNLRLQSNQVRTQVTMPGNFTVK